MSSWFIVHELATGRAYEKNYRRMKLIIIIVFVLSVVSVRGQQLTAETRAVLEQMEQLQLRGRRAEALALLKQAGAKAHAAADLAYLYAAQSNGYAAMDSLLQAKRMADLSMEYAEKSKQNASLAVAYRAQAYLSNSMNMPDAVVKDALSGLKYSEKSSDLTTRYQLYYLLYGAYSKWEDGEKMEKYIRNCKQIALEAANINLQVNSNNGISSMFLARYAKTKAKPLLDSSLHYLNASFALLKQYPDQLSDNTFVITCINLANYYLEYAPGDLAARQRQAYAYLGMAEGKLNSKGASSEKWMNVYGIKSGFARKRGDLRLAEQYLLQGLGQLMQAPGDYFKLEYTVNKELAVLSLQKKDPQSAYTYQQRAEELLKKSFNEQQLFNAQKLEVHYETAKKDAELQQLKERESFRRRQNYLYGGMAIALLFGLVFMFVSYHFRLRYSMEREQKLTREKEDAAQQAHMQLQLEKEEQARLLAEQELLQLRRQQLEKEALANSLIIERRNDTLKQIQDTLKSGETADVQKLIKEELLMQAGFEDIKLQLQELHPDFFNRLHERAVQKLTTLDMKYCTYIHLKMGVKEMAQVLHVEPQSVRMFKYRLKQKFGLGKEMDLEDFLTAITKK